MATVTIFGSSLPGEGSAAYTDAQRLGRLCAESGFDICNGGYGGLMEASARGAREAKGATIGVTCDVWPMRANQWITEEVRTHTYPERLMTLIARGDAYVVLPGGTGTLVELALAWELMNKSVLSSTVGGRKPLLVWEPYWRPVIECLNQEVHLGATAAPSLERFSRAMEIVTLVRDADHALEKLKELLR
ncbi:MAG TPA: LOG family protein [Terriglobia bacterium]|nr:LOG family protein [Terriglobia bacterium]